MSVTNLAELFEHELRDTLDAERQILKALPKMIKAAESEDLKAALTEHKTVTEEQVGRLEAIFKSLDKAARGKHCKGMEGLLAEGSDMIEEEERSPTLDAAMIGAAQKSSITKSRPTGLSLSMQSCLGWMTPWSF